MSEQVLALLQLYKSKWSFYYTDLKKSDSFLYTIWEQVAAPFECYKKQVLNNDNSKLYQHFEMM